MTGRSLPWPDLPSFAPGSVWLAGAGPGDPGLLTAHALNGLAQADVVVYDALVSDGILALAPPRAVLEYAGKRGGKPSMRQPDITRRLIDLAGRGRRVLRLKGGDPFVFGRGGEEALTLTQAGIPVRVIPGVSAGIGGLAYAGIPVTHRDTNHAVTFVTGHGADGAVTGGVDWIGLARSTPVLVIYMAMKHLAAIVERVMAAGRPADEPVAVVCDATLATQRVLISTLGAVVDDAAVHAVAPPAIVVIGPIVGLRHALGDLGVTAVPGTAALHVG